MRTLGWSKEVPTEPGLYMRNNPAMSSIVRQVIFMGEGFFIPKGKLGTHLGGKHVVLEEWAGARKMWWFGPIPEPPKGDEASNEAICTDNDDNGCE